MKITELEIHNILECEYADLKFNLAPNDAFPVYFVLGPHRCEIVGMAIQLICSNNYSTFSTLAGIWSKISNGKVVITFTLEQNAKGGGGCSAAGYEDHSSDSDVPCTSKQAQERAQRRQKRRATCRTVIWQVKACRDFETDPFAIKYIVNNGLPIQCDVRSFNLKFFSCTDMILPRLQGLTYGNCCEGRWLNLLSKDFLCNGLVENHLLIKFCELHSTRKVTSANVLGPLTTTALMGRYCLDQSRVSELIYIFRDIRCIFEYLTFFEYTVWFLLPGINGQYRDITSITTKSINFDFIKTMIELKASAGQPTSSKFSWTDADGYVQELFIVAVQLAFGYNCKQNIVYLHSLQQLNKHLSFAYIQSIFAFNSSGKKQFSAKNYLQRIINACVKCKLTCVVEYMGGIPFKPVHAFCISCTKDCLSGNWNISSCDQ